MHSPAAEVDSDQPTVQSRTSQASALLIYTLPACLRSTAPQAKLSLEIYWKWRSGDGLIAVIAAYSLVNPPSGDVRTFTKATVIAKRGLSIFALREHWLINRNVQCLYIYYSCHPL